MRFPRCHSLTKLFFPVLAIGVAVAGLTTPGPGAAEPAPSGTELGSIGTWEYLDPIPARGGHSAIYDPVRDQMVVFGGTGDSPGGGPSPGLVMFFGSSAWFRPFSSPTAWMTLSAGDAPPTTHRASVIYDAGPGNFTRRSTTRSASE